MQSELLGNSTLVQIHAFGCYFTYYIHNRIFCQSVSNSYDNLERYQYSMVVCRVSYSPGSSSEEHRGDSASSDAFPHRQGCCIYHLTLPYWLSAWPTVKCKCFSRINPIRFKRIHPNHQSSCSLAKRADVLRYFYSRSTVTNKPKKKNKQTNHTAILTYK